MDYILCKKCETGNPSYVRVCSNCNADLFGLNDDSAEKITEENVYKLSEEDEKIADESLATKAIIASVITTSLKVLFLFALTANSYEGFFRFDVILGILAPIVAAAIARAKYRKWYWILIIDSFFVLIMTIIGLFFIAYGMMSK